MRETEIELYANPISFSYTAFPCVDDSASAPLPNYSDEQTGGTILVCSKSLNCCRVRLRIGHSL